MRMPLLLYHDIRADNFNLSSAMSELRPYILRKSNFIEQMQWLHQGGFNVIGLNELTGELESKTVCIVFDDGWMSNYEIALPILKQYGFKANFFVTVDNIGKAEMMSWSQLKQLQAQGMTVGSHSMTHRIPTELTDKELNFELSESKKILEEKLNEKIAFFSVPTGFFDRRIERLAKENGYKATCFTKVAFNNFEHNHNDFIRLNKIGIKRNYSLEMFQNIVKGKRSILFSLRFKQFGRDLTKSFFGPRSYNALKAKIQGIAQ